MSTTTEQIKVLQLRSSGAMLGAENVIIEIASHSQQFNVTSIIGIPILAGDDIPEFAERATDNQLEVQQFHHKSRLSRSLAKDIYRYVHDNSIDVIHCHGYQEDFYAWMANTGKPLVATNHLWKKTTIKLWVYAKLDALILKKFAHSVAVSNPIYDELISVGLSKDKVSMISNGINLDRFAGTPTQEKLDNLKLSLSIPVENKVIGMVSSLTQEKGHAFMLEAFKRGLEQFNEPHTLLIVGDGDHRQVLKEQVETLQLQQHVVFSGPRRDIPDLLSIMDIYVLSSLIEGLPMSLLEAMASGLPAISTDVGDIHSVISDGHNGFLVKAKDINTLANKVVKLANSAELQKEFSKKGQQIITEKFASASMTKSYCDLYHQVLTR